MQNSSKSGHERRRCNIAASTMLSGIREWRLCATAVKRAATEFVLCAVVNAKNTFAIRMNRQLIIRREGQIIPRNADKRNCLTNPMVENDFFRVAATVQRSLVHGNGGPMLHSMMRQFTLWAIGSETTMEVRIYLGLCRITILSVLVVHLALMLNWICCIISEKQRRRNLLVLLTEVALQFCDNIIIINL